MAPSTRSWNGPLVPDRERATGARRGRTHRFLTALVFWLDAFVVKKLQTFLPCSWASSCIHTQPSPGREDPILLTCNESERGIPWTALVEATWILFL